jgi:hypothetical protein
MTSLQIYRYLSKASFVSLFFNQSAELPSASLPQSESRHIYGRLTNPLNDYPGLLSFDALFLPSLLSGLLQGLMGPA